jgi:hypothetical protein
MHDDLIALCIQGVAPREAVKVADQEAGHTNVTDLCREMIQMIHY